MINDVSRHIHIPSVCLNDMLRRRIVIRLIIYMYNSKSEVTIAEFDFFSVGRL